MTAWSGARAHMPDPPRCRSVGRAMWTPCAAIARDLRRLGVACACDLAAGGDGDVECLALPELGVAPGRMRSAASSTRGHGAGSWHAMKGLRVALPGGTFFAERMQPSDAAGIGRLDPAGVRPGAQHWRRRSCLREGVNPPMCRCTLRWAVANADYGQGCPLGEQPRVLRAR